MAIDDLMLIVRNVGCLQVSELSQMTSIPTLFCAFEVFNK